MRVTKKPWFGPKRTLGWGWSPSSWEGWLAMGVFVVLVLGSVLLWPGVPGVVAVVVLIGALLALCLLTGDPPG
jgi:hypothetical protein